MAAKQQLKASTFYRCAVCKAEYQNLQECVSHMKVSHLPSLTIAKVSTGNTTSLYLSSPAFADSPANPLVGVSGKLQSGLSSSISTSSQCRLSAISAQVSSISTSGSSSSKLSSDASTNQQSGTSAISAQVSTNIINTTTDSSSKPSSVASANLPANSMVGSNEELQTAGIQILAPGSPLLNQSKRMVSLLSPPPPSQIPVTTTTPPLVTTVTTTTPPLVALPVTTTSVSAQKSVLHCAAKSGIIQNQNITDQSAKWNRDIIVLSKGSSVGLSAVNNTTFVTSPLNILSSTSQVFQAGTAVTAVSSSSLTGKKQSTQISTKAGIANCAQIGTAIAFISSAPNETGIAAAPNSTRYAATGTATVASRTIIKSEKDTSGQQVIGTKRSAAGMTSDAELGTEKPHKITLVQGHSMDVPIPSSEAVRVKAVSTFYGNFVDDKEE
jgi:hypothetical protein